MAIVTTIDDPGDDRIADYLQLTDAELRRAGEVFLCEGVLVIRRAIASGADLRSVLVTPERLGVLADALESLTVPVYVVDQAVMNAVTGFNIHRGAIASASRPPARPLDQLLAGATTVAVLEGINDSENLGSLFRNAAGFGVGAVLLDPTCIDPLYRRVVRVSLGHVLAVAHGRIDALPSGLDDLRRAGFQIVGLTPDRSAEPVTSLRPGGRMALLLGAEGPGLTPDALAAADRRVRIPMVPGVDSLNVATAAAVAFHRRFGG